MRPPDNVYKFRRLKWRPPELLPSLRRYAEARRRTRWLDGLFVAGMALAVLAGAAAVIMLMR